jgi:hypothetical protein
MAFSGYILDLAVVTGFELGGAAVTKCTVQPGAVVPADVLDDRAPCAGPGGPGAKVEQLAFDRSEERLGQGVIPALAFAAGRQSPARTANSAEVYWQPRSELSRLRLNSDYAEVGVKPRNCGLALSGRGLLTGSSA